MASNKDENTLVTDGTEQTLATITDAGNYALLADLNALIDGERVVIRTKVRALSAGTTRTLYESVYEHAQASVMKQELPVTGVGETIFTIERETATALSIPWGVRQLDG